MIKQRNNNNKMDSIILQNVILTSELCNNNYTFTPIEVHCLNFCGKDVCRNYEVNACYFDKNVCIDEYENISCLIQLSKLYFEEEFYHLFDIDDNLEGFRYGKIIGVIGNIKYMKHLCI